MRHAASLAVVFALMPLAGCFRPDMSEGIACAEGDNSCPGAQVCAPEGVCRLPGGGDDSDGGASTDDGGGGDDIDAGGLIAGTRIVRRLDVLFVVDDSTSMQPHQDALVAGFPAFLDTLEAASGALPDLHLGVLSTNLGADPTTTGAGDYVAAGCAEPEKICDSGLALAVERGDSPAPAGSTLIATCVAG